jgi:steroid delta-isomerase-like uncharacterized protein
MSDANVALVRKAIDEVASQGRFDLLDEIGSADFTRHDLSGGPDIVGLDAIKRFLTGQRTAFPDLTLTIDEIVAEGDRVVARYTARGTHQGKLAGADPTGKLVTWHGINIYRIEDGRLAETWQLADTLGILRQVGALPAR